MRKSRWILLAAASILLVSAATVYLGLRRLNSYVDQNGFQIARKAGEALARPVAFEDMRLSLSGSPSVRIDGLRIGDDPRLSEEDFVSAKRMVVRIRLLPALMGRVEVSSIALDAPRITIIQTGTGFNLDSFARGPVGAPKPLEGDAGRGASKPPVLSVAAPAVAELRMRDARIRYVDRRVSPASEITVDGLELMASDLGSSRPAKIALSASLFGSQATNLELSGSLGPLAPSVGRSQFHLDLDLVLGPVAIDALRRWKPLGEILPAALSSAEPVQIRVRSKGTLDQVALDASVDATRAGIRYGSAFDKPAGVPMRIGLRLARKGVAIEVERAELEAATIEMSASGRVRASSAPSVDLDIQVPAARLAEWQSLLPFLRGFELGGQTEARLHASGPIGEKVFPLLEGTLALRDVAVGATAGMPGVERFSADLALHGDQMILPETTFTFAGSPVTVRASGRNLAQPVIEFDARAAELEPEALGFATGDDADALRDVRVRGELRRAPVETRMTIASANGRLFGAEYDDLVAEAAAGGGVVTLNEAKLGAFGGTLTAKGLYHRAEAPIFELRASASDVLVGALLASRGSSAATAIEGRLRGELSVRGSGRDWPSIRGSLRGGGRLAVDDGVLRDLNLGKAVLTELTSFGGLNELVSPELRERYPQLFGSRDTPFEELAGSVTIADARMSAGDVALRASDYAVRAAGWLDFDQHMDFNASLVLSQELTDDITADVREVRNLTNDARRLEVPFRLRGDFPRVRPEPDSEPMARALRRALLARGAGELIRGERDGARNPEQLEEGLRQLFGR